MHICFIIIYLYFINNKMYFNHIIIQFDQAFNTLLCFSIHNLIASLVNALVGNLDLFYNFWNSRLPKTNFWFSQFTNFFSCNLLCNTFKSFLHCWNASINPLAITWSSGGIFYSFHYSRGLSFSISFNFAF